MYTKEMVIKTFKDYCALMGVDVTVNIEFSDKMVKTIGYVQIEKINGIFIPTLVKFSMPQIETTIDADVKQAIGHEAAHYIATIIYKKDCEHGPLFRHVCAVIGVTANKPQMKMRRVENAKEIYKYTVFCENCGRIKGYARMCATLRDINHCHCSKCKGKVYYKQNW